MVRNFCRDVLWDLNKTWTTEVPDFTSCFQDIILTLVPSVIFSVLGLINVYLLAKYSFHYHPLPWRWLNVTKLVICTISLLISISLFIISIHDTFSEKNLPHSLLVSTFSQSTVFIIVIFMILKQRQMGITTSTLVSLFWICFSACSILQHRSIILQFNGLVDTTPKSKTILYLKMFYYPLIYIGLILSVFSDKRKFDSLENHSPIEEETFLSFITYAWFSKVIYRSKKKALSVKDLFPLSVKLRATFLYDRFSKHCDALKEDGSFGASSNFGWILIKIFWPWMTASLVLNICFNIVLLLPPLLLDRILDFVHNEQYEWRGYLYAFAIFFTVYLYQMLSNNSIFYELCAGSQVKSALIGIVFRKNLLISSAARRNYSSGSLLNLISVDVERIANFAMYAPALFGAPLRIILTVYLMWKYLGPSCLAGVAVILILIPVSFLFSRKSESYTSKQMKIKDIRLKFMNEILSGIKLIKFYVWEVPFSKKVSDTRKQEMQYIRFSQYCYIVTCFVYSLSPYLVAFASFATFLFSDSQNVLNPTIAFVTLSLMDQLRSALFEIPDVISELVQAVTSLKRLKEFLVAEQQDPSLVGNSPSEGCAISFRNANLSWSNDVHPTLHNINLNVQKGKLIAVIGSVGSGKSSLLSALLGEMYTLNGTMDMLGSIAYVPQQAWILNQTLRNNVLFVNHMKEEVYNKVLDRCCLRPDLEVLPGGEQTEIGEKGINLSGGQKQRISLARAVYQDKEIYLLDDPLSAVDVHVRKALFDDVIGNKGLLKKKTRVLVTHDISILPSVDLIVSMKNGEIVEIGTYNELMKKEETFAAFVKEHSAICEEEKVPMKLERTLSRLRSTESTSSRISMESTKSGELTTKFDLAHGAATLIVDENMEIGGVKRGIYKNYLKHVGWLFFIPSILGYIGYVTAQAGGNIWVAHWTSDSVLNGTEQKSQTFKRISVYGAILFAKALSTIVGSAFLVYGSTIASESYHKEMLSSVLRCPMSFFDSTPMGRVMNRFTTDMDVLDVQLVYKMDGWLACLFYVLSSFTVIGINTPVFLAAILPLSILYYFIQSLHLNASRQIKRLESTTRSPVYSQFIESIHGVSSIKAYKVGKEFIEKFNNILDTHITCVVSTISCNRWLHFCLDNLGSFIVVAATALAITRRHELGASIVGLVVSYALSVMDSLMWFVRSNTDLENKAVAVERVDEYTKLKSEAEWNIPSKDPSSEWPSEGHVVFDNYSARYREDLDLALRDICLSVGSNEKVGIIGRTGAGKSSMTLALFRIIEPINGTILIDNVDVSNIGLHALRAKLTIIPQDPVLFTGTLRFNLDPNDEYKDNNIWSSLEHSNLKNFVSELPDGLEYNIEEGGGNLSAGQRQLLCLSRALLKKSRILVLDEATAAVDMDTDQLIQNTIRSAFADRTVITIAHRLNTVMDYDKIVVMDSGKVVEVGKPADLLLDKKSNFYKMTKEAGLV